MIGWFYEANVGVTIYNGYYQYTMKGVNENVQAIGQVDQKVSLLFEGRYKNEYRFM